MISIERFKNLPPSTFLKKSSLILSTAIAKANKSSIEKHLFIIHLRLLELYPSEEKLIDKIFGRIEREGLLALKDYIDSKSTASSVDFDFISDGGELDKSKRVIKERYVYLDNLRSPYNIGSIVRSAESFKIKQVIIFSETLNLNNPNFLRSACRSETAIEITLFNDRNEAIKHLKALSLPIFSLECGGEEIGSFSFPPQGVAIIGSEEAGVSKDLIELSNSVVSIPLYGAKASINVSVATGIMLQKWSEG